MSNTLADAESMKAGRLIKEAQDLVADNPGGLDTDQEGKYRALVEAAEFHVEREQRFRSLDQLSAQVQRQEEVREDLTGMEATREAPAGTVTQTTAEQSHLDKMFGPKQGGDRPTNGMSYTIKLVECQAFSDFVRQGGQAHDWVKQAPLSPATSNLGGNTVPTVIAMSFYDNLFNINGIRKAGATVLTTDGGEPMSLPAGIDYALSFTRNTPGTSTVAGIQTAINDAAADRNPTTRVVTLEPEKYHSYTRVKRELIEDSAVNIEAFVGRMLGRTTGRILELAYAQGRGSASDEPDGWNNEGLVDSAPISGADRAFDTAASNAVGYPDLNKVVYAVDDFGNWNEMSWLMHKGTLGEIIGLVGSDRHPIFKYAPYYGGPDNMRDGVGLLLGYPVNLATYCGRAATDDDVLMMFGAMSQYYIRDVNGIEINRWDQARYLEDEIDFTARIRTDGKFVNPDNFAWLTARA